MRIEMADALESYSRSAEFYDLIYSWKDYASESRALESIIRQRRPAARSLLDLACGTGEHLKFLESFERAGADKHAGFVSLARQKLPEVSFYEADMTSFALGRKFDVITCLFSSIGYLPRDEDVLAFLARSREHLGSGGLLLVEPWFEPEVWQPAEPRMDLSGDNRTKVVRVMVTDTCGEFAVMAAHHLTLRHRQVEYFVEHHRLRLISREKWTELLNVAGFKVESLHPGLTGRGLYVAEPVPGGDEVKIGGHPIFDLCTKKVEL
jgi:SAM-dependent methyltransferase